MSLSVISLLPPEILGCVVANIASLPTLCNLARCSHQLYLCATAHLYRHVTIQEEIRHGKHRKGELQSLASLLIRRPDLAGLVRHFTLHVTRFPRLSVEDSNEYEEHGGFRDQAFATVVNASSLSVREKIDCLGQFSCSHKSYYDLILTLLLPALLKVQKLVLDLKIASDTFFLEMMIQRVTCRERPFDIQPPFRALTVFVLSHDLFSPRSPGFIDSLLKLPAIKKISAGFKSIWDEEDEDLGQFKLTDETLRDSSSSSLTSFDLVAYNPSTVDLGHMLRVPKALKTFSYKICPPDISNFTEVRHALEPLENCLDSLGLDCDKTYNRQKDILRPMTSIVSFNTLKHFKTAAIILETRENWTESDSLINFFPPSLETLHLTGFQPGFKNLLEALEHLLAQKSSRQIPSLRKLILEQSYGFVRFGDEPARLTDVTWSNTQEIAIERLSRVATAHDVSFDVTDEPVDEDAWPPEMWGVFDGSAEWYDEVYSSGRSDSDE